MVVGVVDDVCLDCWGECVICNFYKFLWLLVLEYFYFVGDDCFGVFGVLMDVGGYWFSSGGVLVSLVNLDDMQCVVVVVLVDEKLDEWLVCLVKFVLLFGGVWFKFLIEMDGVQWVVKFFEGEDFNMEFVEYVIMCLVS